ncbi:MAG: hypothetical protein ACKOF7_04325, partial [Phycisphaerales bacterium]
PVTVPVRALARSLVALALVCGAARAHAQAVPASLELSPAVRLALQSAALSDAERAALRLRHGTYDDGDLPDPRARAVAALGRWDLGAPALADAAAPAELRAEALVRRGDAEAALALVDAPAGVRAQLVRARALDALGRAGEAIAAAREAKRLGEQDGAPRDDRMDAVEATALLARLEGRPARDWQTMLDALAVLRDEDRLDPRPRLLEGRLLVEKDRFREGVEALREALSRDLRSAEAMHLLGRVAVQTFDFDGARRASGMLRALGDPHVLADLLDAESALQSRDAGAAIAALEPLERRMPTQRQALALRAAAEGMRFDDAAMETRLDALDGLMPGSPIGHYECGRFLSLARQYPEAAEALGEAARRAPGWSAPIAELGLLEMQSGRDAEALTALRRAVKLDPYDQRARHSLTLAEDLSTWTRRHGVHRRHARDAHGKALVVRVQLDDGLARRGMADRGGNVAVHRI